MVGQESGPAYGDVATAYGHRKGEIVCGIYDTIDTTNVKTVTTNLSCWVFLF